MKTNNTDLRRIQIGILPLLLFVVVLSCTKERVESKGEIL